VRKLRLLQFRKPTPKHQLRWVPSMIANGEPVRACITEVKDGMRIETDVGSTKPLRIIHGPEPRTVAARLRPGLKEKALNTLRLLYGLLDATSAAGAAKTTA